MSGHIKLGYQAGAWGKDMDLAAAEIREAGYRYMEVFGLGRHEGNPESFFEMIKKSGVELSSVYTGVGFSSPESLKIVDQRMERGLDLLRRAGSHELVVGGCWREPEGEGEDDYKRVCAGLNKIGRQCIEQGVRLCLHPHSGTVFVTAQDMEKFFKYTDKDLVFLGPDTSHLLRGGIDPVRFFEENMERIKYVHFKDYDPETGLDYELGGGRINFPRLTKILETASYDGFAVIEHISNINSAIESARMSRQYAKEVLKI